jgi:hypothetical protein
MCKEEAVWADRRVTGQAAGSGNVTHSFCHAVSSYLSPATPRLFGLLHLHLHVTWRLRQPLETNASVFPPIDDNKQNTGPSGRDGMLVPLKTLKRAGPDKTNCCIVLLVIAGG